MFKSFEALQIFSTSSHTTRNFQVVVLREGSRYEHEGVKRNKLNKLHITDMTTMPHGMNKVSVMMDS